MFKPVRTKTASSEVSAQIKEMIKQGQLQPGDRLPPERELAEILGVSRATVREALRSLSAVGMISIRQGEGSFVEHFKLEGILEPLSVLFHLEGDESGIRSFSEVREILEVEMAALAAKRADAEDIRAIDECVAAMVEEVRSGGVGDIADADFHLALAKASKNPLILRLMETITDLMKHTYQASRKQLFLDQETLEEVYNSHSEVAEAIRMKKPQVARQRMKDHLKKVENKMEILNRLPRELGK